MGDADRAEAAKAARAAALRAARRGVILTAAAEAFAAQGVDGTTMRAIASRAGCTTGAIYPLFASKEEIYAALLARSLDALGAELEAACAAAAPGWGRLDAALRAFIGYYLTRPDDLALGFYLTGAGIGRRGLSKTLDAELNAKLMAALAELERGFLEIGVTDPAARRVEMTSAFAGGAGALMLLHTGRLSLLGVGVDAIVERQLAALRALHRGAEPDGAEAG